MELSPDDKIHLLTGKGLWHTNDCGGKIPSILLTDGPHGLRKQEENEMQNNASYLATCFPAACTVASSWDTDAAAELASALADEACAEHVSVVLGPGVNIKRSPLCGRNFEYFSEDPLLGGKLAASYIRALQKKGVAASLKHFAGNNQETRRQTSNSQIDERALREIYLAAFEIAVKEGHPATVMASYNRLNGTFACENRTLLTDILRGEWGFTGAVVSDWGACTDLPSCIKAGMDLEMPGSGGIHTAQLMQALKKGTISEADVSRAAGRIEELVRTYKFDETIPGTSLPADLREKNHLIAKDIACKSAVLLQNDGFLPLKRGTDVLVVGELAEHMRFQGGGSSHIHTAETKNAVESLADCGMHVRYEKGYSATPGTEKNDVQLSAQAAAAVRTAAAGHIPVLFFGGLTDSIEGEGFDRRTLALPQNQLSLFTELRRITPDIAFISFGGSPFEMPFADKARAVLHMYLPGQAAGEACAALITGEVNPSGKLAETFPLSDDDVPCKGRFGGDTDDVEYRESIFTGYRYYDTFKIPVRFPFGHGLSYTTFSYSGLHLSTPVFSGGTLKVSLTVTNTGTAAGAETVQLYVQNPPCNYLRAEKELRAFTKIFLQPGEHRQIELTLGDRNFSVYDEKSRKFVMPSGTYAVLAAASVADCRLSAELIVQGTEYDRDDRTELGSYFIRNGTHLQATHEQFRILYGKETSTFDVLKKGSFTVQNSLEQLASRSLLGKIVKWIAVHSVYLMFKKTSRCDPEIVMMINGILEGTIDSVVCQSKGLVPYRIAEAVVLSANGHPFQSFKKLLWR
ncbi:MAG TPA: glycosyl hydrolase [Treponema sp.]|nr:glycosyl hydrolase [Treponema sp.]